MGRSSTSSAARHRAAASHGRLTRSMQADLRLDSCCLAPKYRNSMAFCPILRAYEVKSLRFRDLSFFF